MQKFKNKSKVNIFFQRLLSLEKSVNFVFIYCSSGNIENKRIPNMFFFMKEQYQILGKNFL